MKKRGVKKNITIDGLAIMVAKGFERADSHFEQVDKKLNQLDESIKATRRDVLDIGDRFVPRHEFDNLLIRFST